MTVGTICYIMQLVVIYVAAAWAKGESWHDGSFLGYVMNTDMVASQTGRWLTRWPGLLRISTLLAWWIEALGTLLLFCPFRRDLARFVCCLLFLSLHATIAITLDIGLFPIFSMVLWLPVIPGKFWDVFASRIKIFASETPHDLMSPEPPGMVRRTGQILLRAIPLTLICAIVMTTLPGFGRFYRLVPVRDEILSVLSKVQLAQSWGIFSDSSRMALDGWYVVEGTTNKGEKIDLVRGSVPTDWARPPLTGPRRASIFWRTFFMSMKHSPSTLDRYAKYLNEKHRETNKDQSVRHIRMIFMQEVQGTTEANAKIEPVEFWTGAPKH